MFGLGLPIPMRNQAGGGLFTPASLSNLVFWFDPSNASSVTLNGGDVSQINDLSGASRNASQGSGANQPAYTTAGINGLNTITYTGANSDSLSVASATTVAQNVGGFSMFAVGKVTSLAALNKILTLLGGGGSPRFNTQLQITTGRLAVQTRRLDTDTNVTTASTTAAGTAGTASFFFWQVDYTTGMATFQSGGTRETVAITWVSGNGNSDNTASSAAPTLGRNGATVYDGDMGEIGAYNQVRTTTEIDRLRTYCTAKWGTA